MPERTDLRIQLGWFLRGGPIWTTKLRLCVIALPLLVLTCLWFAVVGIYKGCCEVVEAIQDALGVCDREKIHQLGERMRG